VEHAELDVGLDAAAVLVREAGAGVRLQARRRRDVRIGGRHRRAERAGGIGERRREREIDRGEADVAGAGGDRGLRDEVEEQLVLAVVRRGGGGGDRGAEPDDLALADAIGGSWTQLASAGELATSWPRYDSVTEPYLQLDTPPSTGAGLATPACDAIDALVP
jgi:hypothetical protein